ncbi:MAG TPA: NlpC/P60 family protein [Treponema sp.]|jgi:cell wall-associated NlpC family hydrolase|nr:NlpC/P60 family protein [Treponema sp.]HBB41935.1 NlpC/P60 family protein [Treponema sp.]
MNSIKTTYRKLAIALAVFAALIAIPIIAAPKVSSKRQKLIDTGLALQGTPYKYAGRTPKSGFDCSGFVSYVAKEALGLKLTAQASQMYADVPHISADEREPGDLIFFAIKGNDGIYRISHVGIYLGLYTGEGKFSGQRVFLHSASDGPYTGVIVSSIEENYWKNHFYGYGRIVPATSMEDQIDAEKVSVTD